MTPEPGTALAIPTGSETETDSPNQEEVGGVFSDAEFQERVEVVMNALKPENDPDGEKQRRAIAEIHTYLSLFDRGIRQMQTDMVASGGPMGMMKTLFAMMRG